MIIKLLLIAIVLLGAAFVGIAIKMFFIKGSHFKKTCASSLPGQNVSCSCGGDGHCHNE